MGTDLCWLSQINEESASGHDDQSEEINDEAPLLGLGGDFDVMNFFNFLDESTNRDSDETPIDVQEESNSVTENHNAAVNQVNYRMNSVGIPSNPWSGNPGTSRATQYGIAVEAESLRLQESRNANNSTMRTSGSTPLLTPQSVLQLNATSLEPSSVGELKEDKEEFFGGDSFFESLLSG